MPFQLDDDDRYSRFQLIAWWDQQKLRRAKVLVVGAGALGNEVLKNLALLGVGTIYVVDFDRIENTNLTRTVLFRRDDCGRPKAEAAAQAVMEMNPDVRAIPLVGNVITHTGLGLFREMDVVIGCLDNREARLWVNRACWKVTRPWVDGGIQEINGVVKVFVPPGSACYECAMTENDYRLINLRYSCPLLPQEDILAGKVPTSPTISSMIAGLQTQEALKLLHDLPVESGAAMVYNGAANRFYVTRYQFREDCLSHETFPDAMPFPLSSREPAAGLFSKVRSVVEASAPLELLLDRDLVVSVLCPNCELEIPIMEPAYHVASKRTVCQRCGELGRANRVHAIAENSPLAQCSLQELGIPLYDIVRIRNGSAEHHILLNEDRDEVMRSSPSMNVPG